MHEQDKNRQQTWSFPSGWPDKTFDLAIAADSSSDLSELVTGNKTAIPDVAIACVNVDNGFSNDPYTFWLCQIAQVNADATLPEHQILVDDQAAIHNSNVSAVNIPRWVPTRQAKTFHPRTLGQNAYAQAIMEVW